MKKLSRELGMLQDLTGQESGIVVYGNGETVIVNWSSLYELPRVFVTWIIGSGGDGLEVKSEERVEDISELIDTDKIIYDMNGDADALPGTSGTVYTLEDETMIIAPDGWN